MAGIPPPQMPSPPPAPQPGWVPPSAPKKKSNATVIAVVLVGIFVVICGGMALAMVSVFFSAFKKVSPLVGCSTSLQLMHSSTLKYAHQHGDKLPNAETWQNDIRPLYQKEIDPNVQKYIKMVPAEGDWVCDDEAKTGIAFNSDVSGKPLAQVTSETPLIFEVEKSGQNVHRPYKPLDIKTSPKMFGEPRGWMLVTRGGLVTGPKSDHSKWSQGGEDFDKDESATEAKGSADNDK